MNRRIRRSGTIGPVKQFLMQSSATAETNFFRTESFSSAGWPAQTCGHAASRDELSTVEFPLRLSASDMSPLDDLSDPRHIAHQRTGCNIRLQQSVHRSPVGSSNRKQRFVSDRNLLHPPHKAAGVVGGSAGERLLAANLWLPWHEATRGRGRRTMHAGSAAMKSRTNRCTEVISECFGQSDS